MSDMPSKSKRWIPVPMRGIGRLRLRIRAKSGGADGVAAQILMAERGGAMQLVLAARMKGVEE